MVLWRWDYPAWEQSPRRRIEQIYTPRSLASGVILIGSDDDRVAPDRHRLAKSIVSSGVGLFSVCSRAPVVASNTYALPAFSAPVSSPGAPTTTVLPQIATAMPKASPSSGVGLFSVCRQGPRRRIEYIYGSRAFLDGRRSSHTIVSPEIATELSR